jgi:SRSO17 transposase
MVEARLAWEKFGELMGRIGGWFSRREPRLQAGKYVSALMGDLPRKNGWTIAAQAGDITPDRTQRLLNRAAWDTFAVMREVRGFAVEYLDAAAGPGTLRVLALDETGQQKQGSATAGVKRQYLGCAGRVANGINTVHVTYATPAGHALIGARQWIPAEQVADPAARAAMGLPTDLEFKTKPELAADILADALAEGIAVPWVAADEVYGNNPALRSFCETAEIGYVLRVPSSFHLTTGDGRQVTAGHLLKTRRLGRRNQWWQVRSAGAGSKGDRLYKWAWVDTTSPRHSLLVRKHLATGELAFMYCFVPQGRPVTLPDLVAVAGMRWPVEEDFEFAKDLFGLDHSQVRLHTAILRHTVLSMAALAICAVTAALARPRTDSQARPPSSPQDQPPHNPGLIPLTVAEVKRLYTILTFHPHPVGHHLHWSWWRRRHQARSRWFHKRTRLRRQHHQNFT